MNKIYFPNIVLGHASRDTPYARWLGLSTNSLHRRIRCSRRIRIRDMAFARRCRRRDGLGRHGQSGREWSLELQSNYSISPMIGHHLGILSSFVRDFDLAYANFPAPIHKFIVGVKYWNVLGNLHNAHIIPAFRSAFLAIARCESEMPSALGVFDRVW